MSEDILRGMGGRMAGLQGLLRDFSGGMPGRVEATDSSGAVQVTLDTDGLPAAFEVDVGWTSSLHPTAFGAAVAEAFTAATNRRLTDWARRLDEVELPDAGGSEKSVAGQQFQPTGQPDSATRPREVGDLVRDLLDLTEDLDAITEPSVWQATGSTASGMLTLTLGSEGTLSCSADQAWASDKTGQELTAALNTALADARRELAAAADASPANRAARLLDEAASLLKGPST
jgi:hypothetical protein